MPVLSVNVEFRTPAVYDEVIRIKCWISRLKGASLEVQYEVSNYETGEVHATGSSSHAFTNPELKPIRVKKEAPEVYRVFAESKEDDDE